jgi:hypothetical protein
MAGHLPSGWVVIGVVRPFGCGHSKRDPTGAVSSWRPHHRKGFSFPLHLMHSWAWVGVAFLLACGPPPAHELEVQGIPVQDPVGDAGCPIMGAPMILAFPVGPGETCGEIGPTDREENSLLILRRYPAGGHSGIFVSLSSTGATNARTELSDQDLLASFVYALDRGWLIQNLVDPDPQGLSGEPTYLVPFDEHLRSGVPSMLLHYKWSVAESPSGGAGLVGVLAPAPDGADCHSAPSNFSQALASANAGAKPPLLPYFAQRYGPDGSPAFEPLFLGCFNYDYGVAVAVNLQQQMAVIVIPPEYVRDNPPAFWMIEPDGTATHWSVPAVAFSVGTSVVALASNAFVLRSSEWLGVPVPDGTLAPPPRWLTARTDLNELRIVGAGKAYVATTGLDCARALEYILADGTSCGYYPLEETPYCHSFGPTVRIGLTGTLEQSNPMTCTVNAWRRLFE